MNTPKLLLLVTCTSLITAIIIVGAYHMLVQPEQIIYETQLIKATQTAEREINLSPRFQQLYTSTKPTNFISAAKDSREAVVFIRSLTKLEGGNALNRDLSSSTGSGVIISRDGYIVTNHHVIEGADIVEVTLNNNKEYIAKVVGSDIQTDMAVLKIEVDQMPYMLFGNSDSLQVGEWVLAVGNPFRLQSTVTAGIVSAKGRNIDIFKDRSGIESFIQTDAAVNPGNSGGALINIRGELIGINTAIMTLSGKYEGFSFAVPSNLARKVVTDLMEYGAVQRGWMGIEIASVTNQIAEERGLPSVAGVFITIVNKESAAFDAGLLGGDVILSVDDVNTNTLSQFMEQIGRHRPGDVINVSYIRKGFINFAEVTLKNILNSTDFVAVRKDKALIDLGFELRDLSSLELSKNTTDGVIVVSVYQNSIIGKANIQPGYIITKINDIEVTDVRKLVEYLTTHTGKIMLEGYYENYPGLFPYMFRNDG